MAECRVCGLECDPEIHRATLSIRSYLKADMERRIVRVDLTKKSPEKIRANAPLLKKQPLRRDISQYFAQERDRALEGSK